jgi:tetratricopeptide (TPR) repeat protein
MVTHHRNALALCILLTIALLLCLTVPAPAVEGWGIENPGVAWGQGHEGIAMDGACYGMVQAAALYHKLGLDKIRPFSEVTDPKPGTLGEESRLLFLEQFAALAQSYTLRNRDLANTIYANSSDPKDVDRSLAGVTPDNPQVLILSNDAAVKGDPEEEPRAHAVLVEGREETDGFIRYTIADPNLPGMKKDIFYEKGAGTYLGFSGYDTVRHDTSTLPEQNRQWFEALLKGAAQPEGKEYLPVWRGEQDRPLTDEEYRKRQKTGTKGLHILEPPVPSQGMSNGMSVLSGEEVGGVRLYFDPAIVSVEGTGARWAMLDVLMAQVTAGQTDFLVQTGGKRELRAVRLRAILGQQAEGATIGDLTRVLGFARHRKTGEVYLLGRREADKPAIPLDVLAVALRVIWQEKATPAISLDPDADDIYGPQRVRLEQFPAGYGETEFTRIMLEADYAMKRIMLGDDPLDIEGFRSFAELIADNQNTAGEYFRWWLYPKDTAGAAVYHTATGDLDIYLYDSDVKLLTETMKRASQSLVGTGSQDPLAERASLLFTRYYDRIEERRPVFQQLHGLFDVAKLAAVLRAQNAADPLFSQAARRPVSKVALPESYHGIGPKIISVNAGVDSFYFYVGGGVVTRGQLRPGDFVPLPGAVAPASLDALARAEDDTLSITVEVPSTLPLDPQQARVVDGEMEAIRALEEVMAGEPKTAAIRLNRVIEKEPNHARARAARAVAHLVRGYYPEALRDIEVAMKGEPALLAFRGRIRMHAGDTAGALADVRAAAVKFPDRPEVILQKTWVEMQAMNLPEAEKDLSRLNMLMPLDPEAEGMRKQMRHLRLLDRTQAQAFLKAQLALPITTALTLSRALTLMQQGQLAAATDLVEQTLKTAGAQKPAQGDALYLEERCCAVLAMLHFRSGKPEDAVTARGYLDRMAKRRPTWPSPLYFRILFDARLSYSDVVQLYLRAVKMPDAGDPLLLETRIREGMDLKARIGYQLAVMGGAAVEKDSLLPLTTLYAVIDSTVPTLPPGPARHLLTLLKSSLAVVERERAGNPLGEAEMKRLDEEFREKYLSTPPVPPGSDAINFLALKMSYCPRLEGKCSFAGTPEQFKETGRLFALVARGLHADWAFTSTLEEAAQISLQAHGWYAGMLADRLKEDERLKEITADYEPGAYTLARTLEGIDRVAEPMVDELEGLTPFSRWLLRSLLYQHYAAFFPEADEEQLNRLIFDRQYRAALLLAENSRGLVELKAASLWIEAQGMALPGRLAEPALLEQTMAEYHRLAVGLNRRFAVKASTQ